MCSARLVERRGGRGQVSHNFVRGATSFLNFVWALWPVGGSSVLWVNI